MTGHIRYMHVERFGTPEVDGIEVGEGWVFPKLDGTNGSIWRSGAQLFAGSRGRLLGEGDADNQGFNAWVQRAAGVPEALHKVFDVAPTWRLFGEWLVPHTFKHYREEAWRRFWVFDVLDGERWIPYDQYSPLLIDAGLDLVYPLARVIHPTEETLIKIAEGNTFLVQNGAGPGEGVVLKRYDFVNRYGRVTWAKFVRNEFKEKHVLAMGVPEKGGEFQVEIAIAEEFVTPALVAKERAKIDAAIQSEVTVSQIGKYRASLIPRLLETVYHCIVTEELWPALKKYKDPTIDFKKLRRHVIAQTKSLAKDLF